MNRGEMWKFKYYFVHNNILNIILNLKLAVKDFLKSCYDWKEILSQNEWGNLDFFSQKWLPQNSYWNLCWQSRISLFPFLNEIRLSQKKNFINQTKDKISSFLLAWLLFPMIKLYIVFIILNAYQIHFCNSIKRICKNWYMALESFLFLSSITETKKSYWKC